MYPGRGAMQISHGGRDGLRGMVHVRSHHRYVGVSDPDAYRAGYRAHGGVTLLLITGILAPQEALAGLSNDGMVTVGVLYIVAAGLQQTGVTQIIVERLLGPARSTVRAQLKLMIPTAIMGAFTNNTPQVAIMIPAVVEWARRFNLRVSDLMMPLSYAAILSGTWTIIGTSPKSRGQRTHHVSGGDGALQVLRYGLGRPSGRDTRDGGHCAPDEASS